MLFGIEPPPDLFGIPKKHDSGALSPLVTVLRKKDGGPTTAHTHLHHMDAPCTLLHATHTAINMLTRVK